MPSPDKSRSRKLALTRFPVYENAFYQARPGFEVENNVRIARHPSGTDGQVRRSLPTSRLLVTYLDRDMEFAWTPKHLDKMSWHRSSSVQIKPLQPTNSFSSANPATIRIDSLDFQSGRRSKKGRQFPNRRHPRGVCYGRLHEPKTLPKYRVSAFLNSSTIRSFALSPASP